MKIICLILARGQSKGVPRKNIKLLNGKPLLSYALTEALKVFPEVYVSTDDWEIKYVAENFGAKVIDRPPELATDNSKSVDAVKHALTVVEAEYVCLINGCTPFLKEEDIRGVLKVLEDTDCDSIVSLVEDFSCHPSKVSLWDGGDNRIILNGNWETGERQQLQKCFKRNTAIYLAKREVIKSGTFFGPLTYGYIMPKSRSLDLNDSHDFLMAELYMKHLVV